MTRLLSALKQGRINTKFHHQQRETRTGFWFFLEFFGITRILRLKYQILHAINAIVCIFSDMICVLNCMKSPVMREAR